MEPMSAWERVAQLDAERVIGELNRQAGPQLILEGPCPGGQVGAAYVRWDNGRRSVLKWRPAMRLQTMQQGPLKVVEVLQTTGYPVPATELAVQLGDAVVTVQELLPGKPIEHFDGNALDQALALNELQAGQLTDHPGIPNPDLYLRKDGPGFCLHGPLREFSNRSRALDEWITATDHEILTGDDAVHLDFHPGNLLAVDGKLTGVIDWDGAARGDRRLDLVTLRFGVHLPSVVQRLDAVLDTFPDEVLRPLWAHMSLRMVDWAIRHFPAHEVDHWLDLAEQRAR
jgi:phosphotransferase family enzyme